VDDTGRATVKERKTLDDLTAPVLKNLVVDGLEAFDVPEHVDTLMIHYRFNNNNNIFSGLFIIYYLFIYLFFTSK